MIPKRTRDFILAAAGVMTSGDIAEELSIHPSEVSKYCRELGVKAISVRQAQKNYVLSVYKRHTAKQIADKLEINMQSVWMLAEELNIVLLTKTPEPEPTAAKALSSYKFAEDNQQFPVDYRTTYHEG